MRGEEILSGAQRVHGNYYTNIDLKSCITAFF